MDFEIRGNGSVRFFLVFTGFTIFKQSDRHSQISESRSCFLMARKYAVIGYEREVIEEWNERKEKEVWEVRERTRWKIQCEESLEFKG